MKEQLAVEEVGNETLLTLSLRPVISDTYYQ